MLNLGSEPSISECWTPSALPAQLEWRPLPWDSFPAPQVQKPRPQIAETNSDSPEVLGPYPKEKTVGKSMIGARLQHQRCGLGQKTTTATTQRCDGLGQGRTRRSGLMPAVGWLTVMGAPGRIRAHWGGAGGKRPRESRLGTSLP